MTVISRPRNRYGFLFGTGVDGDVTISANTNLTSTLNGDIVYRNYMNLTINSGCTLSVSNPCKGLWIRVRGVLTLDGDISMSGKGANASGAALWKILYDDITIPLLGGAGGAGNAGGYGVTPAGSDGTDGGCGGGGGGGGSDAYNAPGSTGGHGAQGYRWGGGGGGAGSRSVNGGAAYNGQDGTNSQPGASTWAGGRGAGILILCANQIVGNGSLLALGSNGSPATSTLGYGDGGGGAGGGGSILLYYLLMSGTPILNANGGIGGAGYKKPAGGNGGAGSCRDYSLAELLSHTRL
jgi:hypothetical protein